MSGNASGTQALVDEQAEKIRKMKEAMKADPAAISKADLDKEVCRTKFLHCHMHMLLFQFRASLCMQRETLGDNRYSPHKHSLCHTTNIGSMVGKHCVSAIVRQHTEQSLNEFG
jgi:hypothetical protein